MPLSTTALIHDKQRETLVSTQVAAHVNMFRSNDLQPPFRESLFKAGRTEEPQIKGSRTGVLAGFPPFIYAIG